MAYSKEEIEETFERIIQGIAEDGESLRSVLNRHTMPDATTFYKWLESDEEKSKQYARACGARADNIFEEILDISDNNSLDITIDDEGKYSINGEIVQRSKLKVDSRKWVLSKMNPKKYGDKSTTVLEGGEKPIEINFED